MKSIEFIPSSEECKNFVSRPIPAKKIIPQWYKKGLKSNASEFNFNKNDFLQNTSLKSCMPFFDAISSGYVQLSWTDIFIKMKEDKKIEYQWKGGPQIISHREQPNIDVDKDMFYKQEFVWIAPWMPKLPKGYSALYVNPLNRLDLPFFTLSGIIDSDLYYHTFSGKCPFFIKKGYEGIIPIGTPMYQIIPIKRERWESFESEFDFVKKEALQRIFNSVFYGAYKKMFWQKKEYN